MKKPYSTSDNVIVISDEAQRTQAGRLARNMRLALPNAAFIGFTGTPLFKYDHRRYQEIIADYNREKDRATVEQTFAALVKLFSISEDESGFVFLLFYRRSTVDLFRQRAASKGWRRAWFEYPWQSVPIGRQPNPALLIGPEQLFCTSLCLGGMRNLLTEFA